MMHVAPLPVPSQSTQAVASLHQSEAARGICQSYVLVWGYLGVLNKQLPALPQCRSQR
jgi:hypothetical protein